MSTLTVPKPVLDAWQQRKAAITKAYHEHPYVNPAVRTCQAGKERDAALREAQVQQATADFLSVVVEELGESTRVEFTGEKLHLNGEVISE